MSRDDTSVFFFNDTATTEIYTLSLHDALPISARHAGRHWPTIAALVALALLSALVAAALPWPLKYAVDEVLGPDGSDRKSTRLNSSHANISYAVFCLKKKTELHLSSHTLHALI